MPAFLLGLLASQAMAQDGALALRQVDIMDPSGFARPVRYAISVIPRDWTTEGGIVWNVTPGCANGANLAWQATAPAGEAAIVQGPNMEWRYSNVTGWSWENACVQPQGIEIENLAHIYLSGVLQLQDVRIGQVHADPALDQAYLANLQSQVPPQAGSLSSSISGAIRAVEFTFSSEGKQLQGALVIPLIFYSLSDAYTGTQVHNGQFAAPTLFATERGRYQEFEPVFETYLKNFRTDPAWTLAKWQSDAEFRRRNPKPSSNWQVDTTGSDILDIQMQGYKARDSLNSDGQARAVDGIHGVTTFGADTPTGEVQLPSTYDYHWQLNDGTILSTNDSHFDPGADGRRLTPLR